MTTTMTDFSIGKCDECGTKNTPVRFVDDKIRTCDCCTTCCPVPKKLAEQVALLLGGTVKPMLGGARIVHPKARS